jgi:hypothetical protein
MLPNFLVKEMGITQLLSLRSLKMCFADLPFKERRRAVVECKTRFAVPIDINMNNMICQVDVITRRMIELFIMNTEIVDIRWRLLSQTLDCFRKIKEAMTRNSQPAPGCR